MGMTPREMSRWMEGYNVKLALDANMHGAKVKIPQYGNARAVGCNVPGLAEKRKEWAVEDAAKAVELGIPVK